MIKILVKAFNKETCETREQIYKVESITEYVTKVKPNFLKIFEMYNMELIGEFMEVSF